MLWILLVSCFHQHLSWLLPTFFSFFLRSLTTLTFWLTPQLCIPQTSSKYRLFCLSQCDKPSSFNNCLFDISGSIKRFPNVTFPYSQAFTCLPLLDQWLCQVKKWRVEWRTFHCSLRGLIFQEWNFWQPLSSSQNVWNSLHLWFHDNVRLSSFQWCHVVVIRHKEGTVIPSQ